MNTKKRIQKTGRKVWGWGILIFFAGLAVACGGSDGEEGDLPGGNELLVLKADKETVENTGADPLTFTVWLGDKNVTLESSIVEQASHQELKSNVFSPTEIYKKGTYTFKANYRKYVSPEVKVNVKNGDSFLKHLFLMEFTSVDCPNCPRVAQALEEEVVPISPDRIDVLALHGDMQGAADPWTHDFTYALLSYFKLPGYPSVVIDHEKSWSFDMEQLTSSLEEVGLVGIALKTSALLLNNTGTNERYKLSIEVGVKSRKDFEEPCTVAVVVMENNKKTKGRTFQWVLRDYLTDMYGDKETTGKGSIARGKEWTNQYECTLFLEENGSIEDVKVMAYVLSAERKALNVRQVKAGESVDYENVHD